MKHFWYIVSVSDNMMLNNYIQKNTKKTYIYTHIGWGKPTQDRIKKHMSTNKYIVYTWICLKARCLFLVPKRVLWEENRTPHFETPPPHTHFYIYILKTKNINLHINRYIYINTCIYTYTHKCIYIYIYLFIYLCTRIYIYIHILHTYIKRTIE